MNGARWRAIFVMALALAPTPALARNRTVLVLDTGEGGRPLAVALNSSFRTALIAAVPSVTIYEEALDLARFPDAGHVARLRLFLGDKFRDRPPDVVVPLADPAIHFVLEGRDVLWPAAAIVFAASSEGAGAARGARRATGIVSTSDPEGTVKAALALLPATDEVALVAGSDPFLHRQEAALARQASRLRVDRIVDLPLDETARRLAALPDRAIVLYSQITRDPSGRAIFGRDALVELAPHSRRPIFSDFATYLGHGIVGGSLFQADVVGRDLARLVARVLGGTPPEAIPVEQCRASRLQFDWRELQRFGLDESRLPAGSEVLYRPPGLLEEHRGAVVTAAVLLAVQAGLIAALAWAVQRRRMAQRALRRLSGRILTAQEDERSRIARELHDGASQDLALFAIELDQLAAGVSAPSEVPVQARAAAGRARGLSRELHRIAYELHPAILDQLGLVPALRQFANQLAASHGLRVEVNESDWPRDLSPDVALALYRIAQEALQNAAKHSGAGEARVSLRGSAKGVTLMVSDQGRGFDPGSTPSGASLGLVGMKERLRLVDGELCVDSSAAGGTVIAASVPRQALAAAASGGEGGEGDDPAESPAR